MSVKVTALVLLFLSLNFYAQTPANRQSQEDELVKHISAAETYQISGDLENARIENRAIVGIGLHRFGNISIEEGKYGDAAKMLSESKLYADNGDVRVDLAVAYLRMNQIENALEEARTAVQLAPQNSYARYVLGNIYFTKGDYQAALPELEKVLVIGFNFEAARALGLTYLYLKQIDRAKLLFEEIQSILKDESPELHIIFGQAYEQTNYPLEAEREFKRALAINPKQEKANFFLGYVVLQHGGSERLGEAGQYFEKELQISPNDFYTIFFAGVVASSENNHPKAVELLKKAVQIRPNSSAAYLFLGQSQLELNDLKSAEASLRRSVELSKKDDIKDFQSRRTHFMLGRLLIKTGRRDEGEKELKIAQQLQDRLINAARDEISQILSQVVAVRSSIENETIVLPPARIAELTKSKQYLRFVLAQSFHNLAVIAVQTGNPAEALEKFESASGWMPDFENLDRNWGIVAFRTGQYEKAIAPLARHLKKTPQDVLIRRMLGATYYFTKDFAKTVETLKPMEATLPTDAELAYFYGLSLVQVKRNQEAIPIFNQLAANSQNNPESLFYAAQGFMIMGDFERAVKEFQTVVKLAPNTAKANYFIGQSLIRLNRFDQAESYFAKELELNPTDFVSKYHLALTFIERKIETEKTVKLLLEAVDLKYDYADARYQLGKIYLEKGETQKAIEQLEIAATADPNKDFIRYQLSIAYRKASRKEDADRELKRYQELKAANRKNDAPM